MRVYLNEYDIRYLASCHSLDLTHFKKYLSRIGNEKENLIEVEWPYLSKFFPKLDKNYISKLNIFKIVEGSIVNYFEGTSEDSHNYQYLKEILTKLTKFNLKKKIYDVENLFDCLTLVGKRENNYLIFLPTRTIEETELYLEYLKDEEILKVKQGNYFTLHNLTNGKRIVIRVIDEETAKGLIFSTSNYFNILRNNLYEA